MNVVHTNYGQVAKLRMYILACRTIRDELQLAMKETGINYPVVYVDSGSYPGRESLHRSIQAEVDKINNADVILMVLGYCGNSLMEVKSSSCKIVIPRVNDCIALLLGSADERKKKSQEMNTYFFTQGWLEHEKNILREYERCMTLYGQERTLRVMKTMLGNYRRFMVINTGAYPLEAVVPKVRECARKLNMLHEIVPGSLRLLHKLLLGQWDEEFIVLEPGQEITIEDICMVKETGSG